MVDALDTTRASSVCAQQPYSKTVLRLVTLLGANGSKRASCSARERHRDCQRSRAAVERRRFRDLPEWDCGSASGSRRLAGGANRRRRRCKPQMAAPACSSIAWVN